MVLKKTVYNKLVAKVNNIDISGFILKTTYDIDKSDLEKKTPVTNGISKRTNYIAKITEKENKIPSISCLATTALTAVEKNTSNF